MTMPSTQPQNNAGIPAWVQKLPPFKALCLAALVSADTPRGIPRYGITRSTKFSIRIPAHVYLEWRRAREAREARKLAKRQREEARAAMPRQRNPSDRAAAKKAVGKITKRV